MYWVLERLIWPINPEDPYPGTTDGKFPTDWQYIFDPLGTLTFVAANTEKIALGTSVIDETILELYSITIKH